MEVRKEAQEKKMKGRWAYLMTLSDQYIYKNLTLSAVFDALVIKKC